MRKKDASVRVLKLTYSALYLAIALVLPFLTGQIPQIGSMLCPMHNSRAAVRLRLRLAVGAGRRVHFAASALRALRHAGYVSDGCRHGV